MTEGSGIHETNRKGKGKKSLFTGSHYASSQQRLTHTARSKVDISNWKGIGSVSLVGLFSSACIAGTWRCMHVNLRENVSCTTMRRLTFPLQRCQLPMRLSVTMIISAKVSRLHLLNTLWWWSETVTVFSKHDCMGSGHESNWWSLRRLVIAYRILIRTTDPVYLI